MAAISASSWIPTLLRNGQRDDCIQGHKADQLFDIMCFREVNASNHQQRLDEFFNALLGVETDGGRWADLAQLQ